MTITTEQRERRRSGIGGSDAPAIVGVSPYVTPLALWLDKIGEADERVDAPTIPMKIGNALERLIMDELGQTIGCEIVPFTETLRDPEHPYLLGHPDGVVMNRLEGAEAKWVSFPSDEWGEPETDQVPPHVFIQCTHYLMVTGWTRYHVGMLSASGKLNHYIIERNEDIIAKLRAMEIEFWNLVQSRIAPPMTSVDDAALLFTKDDGSTIVATPHIVGLVEQLRHVKSELESYTEIKEGLEGHLKAFMGEAATLVDPLGNRLATWKSAKPADKVDIKALASAHPTLAKQFTVTAPAARRFLLK